MKKPKSPKERRPNGGREDPGRDRISVLNRQRKLSVDCKRLAAAVAGTLARLGLPGSELTVALVSDRAIRALNRRYLGRNRPTDVLAFSQREGPFAFPEDPVLGDVVISVETAARQAAEHGVPFIQELDLLVVHGILHLLGYDHARSSTEALRMKRQERKILRRLRHELPP
jgi:probable rRNA maturation factor